jgi:hypothetical protein
MFLESKQYIYLEKGNPRVIIDTPENALIYLLEFIDYPGARMIFGTITENPENIETFLIYTGRKRRRVRPKYQPEPLNLLDIDINIGGYLKDIGYNSRVPKDRNFLGLIAVFSNAKAQIYVNENTPGADRILLERAKNIKRAL